MKIIGLTGGIASGKSFVSDILKEEGIIVIDADIISREIVFKGSEALKDIEQNFGKEVLNNDGTLNRKRLGSLVFSDKNKLETLNKIMHPKIIDEIKKRIETVRMQGVNLCVIDAPLLIETGLYHIVDIVLLVYVNREVQIKRLIKRDNISFEEAEKRISSQMSFEEKKKYSDYIIDNNGSRENTKKQIHDILEEIISMED
ncbi:dephospho-CoA kinase [Caloramator quimbayensis]|uniref:Dephospho-CoA kinase n=1 Tax=Caloramator quimbayensis TaxID=1147123 RepID=A0A1T4YDZ1_9CLOT|nr:dephospho-CoA kinase [Caloramator quimbayensis]SKA99913.1 dephospho-CoA kinase [Caloramator quimbayensis]